MAFGDLYECALRELNVVIHLFNEMNLFENALSHL